ncbi:MAG: adenylyl-sulfate kinase [Bryobacterales bacterium]|nr:adenylyl-sulfate kinase [Bryobacterales bacterium]
MVANANRTAPLDCYAGCIAMTGIESGCTIWFTGLSGSGKSTLSTMLAEHLRRHGARVEVLDGDVVRTQLCRGLGFSKADREENIRRVGFVCELLARHGVVAIAAVISPYRSGRDEVRSRIPRFFEIHTHCPIEVLVERDPKGLYQKALTGEIANFTGVSDPYEPPLSPEAVIDSSLQTPQESLSVILRALEAHGLLPPAPLAPNTIS